MFSIEEQEDLRNKAFANRNRRLSRAIAEVLQQVNPFARFLQSNTETLRQ